MLDSLWCMKTTTLLSILITSFLSLATMTSSGQEPSKKEVLAGQLLDQLKMQKLLDSTYSSMSKMQEQAFAGAGTKLSPEAQVKASKQMEASMEIVKKEMGWDTIKPIFVKIYADNFDEAELEGIIAYYKTPVGQKWIEKQPAIQAETMQAMTQIMPKIQAAMMKAMKQTGDKTAPTP